MDERASYDSETGRAYLILVSVTLRVVVVRTRERVVHINLAHWSVFSGSP